MAIYETRRLRREHLDSDEKALVGIQTLPDYNPRDSRCTSAVLAALAQKMQAAQREEIRAAHALEVAHSTAIAAEWEVHNALLKAKNEVRVQYGEDSDALATLGLKRRCERRPPSRRKAKSSQKAAEQ